MTIDFSVPSGVLLGLLPEVVLTAWALVLLILVGFRHRSVTDLRLAAGITGLALVSAIAAAWWLWWHHAGTDGLPGLIAVDDYRWITDFIVLGAAGLTVLLSQEYLEREGLLAPEFYLLLLFATIGMLLMVGGGDLIVIFLGLETMSVSAYVLAAFDRRSARGAEAGIKYFLLGAFASGFMLYGIALLYGAAGTTNLSLIGATVHSGAAAGHPLLLIGLALLLVGFGFKVAAVPFHTWAPDVYDGAPTPVAAFMAAGVKAAAFAALVRVLVTAFPGVAAGAAILSALAVATMLVGNLVALAQVTVKRMLAWSSVAHAGYLLVALAAGGATGTAAFLTYMVAYGFTVLAAFGIVAWLGRHGESDVRIDDLAGLATRHPWLAAGLAVAMLSLLGFPGTAGFIGKWHILLAATETGRWTLAVLLVGTSVVSAGFYLPVIMVSYMRPPAGSDAHASVRPPLFARIALAAAVVAVLAFGIWPNRLLVRTRETGKSLAPPAAASVSGAGAATAATAPER